MPVVLSTPLLHSFQPLLTASETAVFRAPDLSGAGVNVGERVPLGVAFALKTLNENVRQRQETRGAKIPGLEIFHQPARIGRGWSQEPETTEIATKTARVVIYGGNTVFESGAPWFPIRLEIRKSRSSMEGIATVVQRIEFTPAEDDDFPFKSRTERRRAIVRGWNHRTMTDLSHESLAKDPIFEGWHATRDPVGGTLSKDLQNFLRVTRGNKQIEVDWGFEAPVPAAIASLWNFVMRTAAND